MREKKNNDMNKSVLWFVVCVVTTALVLTSCHEDKKGSEKEKESTKEVVEPSPFIADNAYKHIEQQVNFGPRVPNSDAHKACSAYLIDELKKQSLEVHEQEMVLTAYDGTLLNAVNIIGSYRPELERRIMIFAHWDTRPVADHDDNPSMTKKPIDGADDGASGPGVMLELARLLNIVGLNNIGVDLIFFDAEDYGVPVGVDYKGNSEETWALGTQYWTRNLHKEGYAPEFGILLDMVGAEDATFYREYFSQESAGTYVTKIWQVAEERGLQKFFVNKMGGAITDDHFFVIKNLRIPCVDIINYDPNTVNGFGEHWHTHNDNIERISVETLQAVGETVWQVLLDLDQSSL